MDKLNLTIAVAIYNVEKYLAKCLESLLNQTERNGYEILLINDGSTDNSRKICEEFINKGLKAEIIDKENGGIVSVRNLSIDLAKGENILFLDGDDYIENDTIEVIFKELEDYDMLVFGFNWIKNNIKIKDERFETTEVSYRDNLSLLEHDIYI
jgi:glycosyltransferase involved in cell wall biosynthesis